MGHKNRLWTGRVLTGVAALFLLFDADCTENRGLWNQVEGDAYELDDAEVRGKAQRVTQLGRCLHDRCGPFPTQSPGERVSCVV